MTASAQRLVHATLARPGRDISAGRQTNDYNTLRWKIRTLNVRQPLGANVAVPVPPRERGVDDAVRTLARRRRSKAARVRGL